MARSWHYPRWRRTVMQVVLWVIFAGTVGAAALVSRERARAGGGGGGAALEGERTRSGPLTFRLPAGWASEDVGNDGDPADATGPVVVARAVAPDPAGRANRVLTIQYDWTTAGSAADYLTGSGLLAEVRSGGRGGPVAREPVTVAGWPGVMVSSPAGRATAARYVAVGVGPRGLAVVVTLETARGSDGAADRAVVRQVAGAVAAAGTR